MKNMKNNAPYFFYLHLILLTFSCETSKISEENTSIFDVVIVGGGASGTMSGLQSARMGVSTMIIEETPWLGGMFTAAGVSAIDGNYRLQSGLWQEFREKLISYYGHEDSLKTGWVSNVLFEPHKAAEILIEMAKAEPQLKLSMNNRFLSAGQTNGVWNISFIRENSDTVTVKAKILIDGTELGDVAKHLGVSYDIGMDSGKETNEDIAPNEANNIVQDLTYVAILKDYGPNADKTISRPDHYDPTPFFCSCDAGLCENQDPTDNPWTCQQMMNYGKLPNGYYMINWPIAGNDYYLNLIDSSLEKRQEELLKAKAYTLNYIYYIQTTLGFKHLGIADDVFPTEDNLPFIPYHRESRRIKGLVQVNINDLAKPFQQEHSLYRTGIAVGDYPVDHHHKAYPNHEILPDLHFYPIPSYSIPIGVLIPKKKANFLVVEKSISVTNLVNGTTRLQPVCMLIGQAAGALAALSIKRNQTPEEVSIREVQKELLNHGAFILPYSDINPASNAFIPLQRIGATGILRGEGKNIGWENHTYIYPDSLLTVSALKIGLSDWLDTAQLSLSGTYVKTSELEAVFSGLSNKYNIPLENSLAAKIIEVTGNNETDLPNKNSIKRADFAILLDAIIDPFMLRQIDHFGNFEDTEILE